MEYVYCLADSTNFLLTGVIGPFPDNTDSIFSMQRRSNPSCVSIATPPI